MKTLRLIGLTIMAVVMTISFTSCGDDDEEEESTSLVGTWEFVSSTSNDSDAYDSRLTFTKDGYCYWAGGDVNFDEKDEYGKYEYKGDIITHYQEDGSIGDIYTVKSLSANQLVIIWGSETVTFKRVK